MIKIICPVCGSDDVDDISEVCETSIFICDNCNHKFKLDISDDTWEFDTK